MFKNYQYKGFLITNPSLNEIIVFNRTRKNIILETRNKYKAQKFINMILSQH